MDTVARLKLALIKCGLNPYKYALKSDGSVINLCVGRDNPDFDEGGRGDDILQGQGDYEVCADVCGSNIKVVSWD